MIVVLFVVIVDVISQLYLILYKVFNNLNERMLRVWVQLASTSDFRRRRPMTVHASYIDDDPDEKYENQKGSDQNQYHILNPTQISSATRPSDSRPVSTATESTVDQTRKPMSTFKWLWLLIETFLPPLCSKDHSAETAPRQYNHYLVPPSQCLNTFFLLARFCA